MDVRIERANEFENDSRFGTTQSAALRVTVTVCPLGRYECANVSVQARKQGEHEKTGSNTHTHTGRSVPMVGATQLVYQ